MPYIIFIFEIMIPIVILMSIFYFMGKAIKKLLSWLSVMPSQEERAYIPPAVIMPDNFKPSQASIEDMISYWESFAYHTNRVIPALSPDLTSIGEVLKQLKIKSDNEVWQINARPAQIRDIAEIIYINYPRFIVEYSQLPSKMQHTPTVGAERSAYHLLIDNSNFLATHLEELSQDLFLNNIKEMMVQEQFVKTKYDKASK